MTDAYGDDDPEDAWDDGDAIVAQILNLDLRAAWIAETVVFDGPLSDRLYRLRRDHLKIVNRIATAIAMLPPSVRAELPRLLLDITIVPQLPQTVADRS